MGSSSTEYQPDMKSEKLKITNPSFPNSIVDNLISSLVNIEKPHKSIAKMNFSATCQNFQIENLMKTVFALNYVASTFWAL